MKALTLHPEHAELFRLGIRSIETRSWQTKYRGRIALHAGMRDPDSAAALRDELTRAALGAIRHSDPLTRGAIVATANLVDCVPMIEDGSSFTEKGDDAHPPLVEVIGTPAYELRLWLPGFNEPDERDVSDQLPFGDFAPGRWAWLLDDIAPTTDRCPVCWGERGDPDDEGWRFHGILEPGSRGPCPMCDGAGKLDPIPARGRQGLFEWMS